MRGHSMHGAHIDEGIHDGTNIVDKKVLGDDSPLDVPSSLEEGDLKGDGIHSTDDKIDEDGLSQLIGVAILEFAVMFQ